MISASDLNETTIQYLANNSATAPANSNYVSNWNKRKYLIRIIMTSKHVLQERVTVVNVLLRTSSWNKRKHRIRIIMTPEHVLQERVTAVNVLLSISSVHQHNCTRQARDHMSMTQYEPCKNMHLNESPAANTVHGNRPIRQMLSQLRCHSVTR
jgi:hypothetical protein